MKLCRYQNTLFLSLKLFCRTHAGPSTRAGSWAAARLRVKTSRDLSSSLLSSSALRCTLTMISRYFKVCVQIGKPWPLSLDEIKILNGNSRNVWGGEGELQQRAPWGTGLGLRWNNELNLRWNCTEFLSSHPARSTEQQLRDCIYMGQRQMNCVLEHSTAGHLMHLMGSWSLLQPTCDSNNTFIKV